MYSSNILDQIYFFDDFIKKGIKIKSENLLDIDSINEFISNTELSLQNKVLLGFFEPIIGFSIKINTDRFIEIFNTINEKLFDNFFEFDHNDGKIDLDLTENLTHSIIFELLENARRFNEKRCKLKILTSGRISLTFYAPDGVRLIPSKNIMDIKYSTKINGSGFGSTLIKYASMSLNVNVDSISRDTHLVFLFSPLKRENKIKFIESFTDYVLDNLENFYYGVSPYIFTHSKGWFIHNTKISKMMSSYATNSYKLINGYN